MGNVRSSLQGHPVAGYFVLALTISWLIALPLVLATNEMLAIPVPLGFHYLASLGPPSRHHSRHKQTRRPDTSS